MILRRRPSPLEMFGQTKFDEGYEKGERCNRMNDNTTFHCLGIIDELESDDSCTCHTGHPPCFYCVTSRLYCPICNWDGREEQMRY